MSMAAPSPSSPWVIVELPEGAAQGFQPYGGGLALWKNKDPEVIISGPAETGKTRTALEKLDALMWKYPRSQAIIIRKTFKSLKTSVLLTFEHKVLGAWNPHANNGKGAFDQNKTPVIQLGGEHPEGYLYPNGSRIYLGGMDSPDKVLSSEWDVVYVNQAEELTLNDWEIISTRTTGRAGNMPYAQMIADCNPGHPTHWIRSRARLKLIESRHEDNPILFDQKTHQITEQGKRSLAVLDALTGVRYRRLRLGQWAAAEGAVYEEFDRAVHLIDPFPIPKDWIRIRAIDFGYTNPFICQWWVIDPDGRLYLYREIYMRHLLVEDAAVLINRLSEGENIYTTVADHDAEDRATLERHGIPTIAAMKAVSPGIQAVQSRLRKAGDGKPRLYVLRGALVEVDQSLQTVHKPLCTEEEFDSYIWRPTKDGTPNKEDPLKKDDHGMDTARYAVAFVDGVSSGDEELQETVTVLEDDSDYGGISPV
jgi:phage terminase large subunit